MLFNLDSEKTANLQGGLVLNDATGGDARLFGLDQIASIVPNGTSIPRTEYDQILEEARACIDRAVSGRQADCLSPALTNEQR